MRTELLVLTSICTLLTVCLISKSLSNICKARRNLHQGSIAYKARAPLYTTIIAYIISIMLYTLVIYFGAIVPAFSPFLDITLDIIILTAICLWFLKWYNRLEMYIMINYCGNLVKDHANG